MCIILRAHHNKSNTPLVDYLRKTLLDQLDVLNFDEDQNEKFLMFRALVLDYIWKWRNKIVLDGLVLSEDRFAKTFIS